jgi:hypothetical protein
VSLGIFVGVLLLARMLGGLIIVTSVRGVTSYNSDYILMNDTISLFISLQAKV